MRASVEMPSVGNRLPDNCPRCGRTMESDRRAAKADQDQKALEVAVGIVASGATVAAGVIVILWAVFGTVVGLCAIGAVICLFGATMFRTALRKAKPLMEQQKNADETER